MNILVTGATGYLGSHLATAFAKAGNSVTIVKRSSSKLERLTDILSNITVYDVEKWGVEAAFSDHKFDAIVHTATCYGRDGEKVEDIFATNTLWPMHLLAAAAGAGVGLFLNTDTSLDRYLNPYAMSKKQFSEWGAFFARQEKIRFVNVALEHFYGPGDDESKFVSSIIRKCLRNEGEIKLTSGEQRRDFVYISDVICAYELLLYKPSSCGTYYSEYEVGSGTSITIKDLVNLIKDTTGSSVKLNFGAIPLRKNEVMESSADIGALVSLGWKPEVSLINGLRTVIQSEKALMGMETK